MDAFPSMRAEESDAELGVEVEAETTLAAILIRRQTQSLLLPFSLLIARFVFVWREIELGSLKLKSRVR